MSPAPGVDEFRRQCRASDVDVAPLAIHQCTDGTAGTRPCALANLRSPLPRHGPERLAGARCADALVQDGIVIVGNRHQKDRAVRSTSISASAILAWFPQRYPVDARDFGRDRCARVTVAKTSANRLVSYLARVDRSQGRPPGGDPAAMTRAIASAQSAATSRRSLMLSARIYQLTSAAALHRVVLLRGDRALAKCTTRRQFRGVPHCA
jgi:hypothetical protein